MTIHRVVTAALVEEGHLLLCHRSPSRRWYPNVWDLPGGHVEAGESETDALRRELREEVGVEIRAFDAEPHARIRGGAEDAPEGVLRQGIWVVRTWLGTPVNREPAEHDDMRWVALPELARLDLAHPSYAQVFEEILTS
ncbi:NUDIX domain-containing protein [Kineosporia succinea]|uniref:8-oxo-dGTP diphosphatase n=1 Tax=Kineosporia succinea TaxID=84632 RepID=A0ABT9NW12_9ACTN|nr:NUDIX domain-containing protein [Kineosporia succinea]MDP9824618.1 mutator protein MutT [Kineosporia succinea]